MKRKYFYSLLREYGFSLFRNNGKHEVYKHEIYGSFAVPRGGNIISKGILWNLNRKINYFI